jgi:hypothetical protein
MKPASRLFFAACIVGLLPIASALATNPLIVDQFTADPTARVFEGRIYVYPSHDIKAPPEYKGRPDWFVMEDYHVFSSANLTDWKDHGVIVKQTGVEWTNPTAYAMWAPDCVFKDGKYYFYFPAIAKTGGMRIGVAVADKPYGPFKPETSYIEGVSGIDPAVLIDKDGGAYLYYAMAGKLHVAKLKSNMREIEGDARVIENLPPQGLIEGPFVFQRNGTYYLTYPHVENKIERLEYATSTSPTGPFKQVGVILDESESGCWTVHHSIVFYKDQWYLFYHDRDLSPSFDKNRSIRADKLFFNADGTIRKVTPTLRGVGLVPATAQIQIDRYSASSGKDLAVSFLDNANPQSGWKAMFGAAKSWVRFDEVDFGRGRQKSIEVRAKGLAGAKLEIRLDKQDGPMLARIELDPANDWKNTVAAVNNIPAGVHDLFVTLIEGAGTEVDWVSFR